MPAVSRRDPALNTLIGAPAPEFSAIDSDGASVDLSALRTHKNVILVFYPGDFTPACTTQLCRFRDDWELIRQTDTVVYGINPANERIHSRFAKHSRLPFPLIADRGGVITAAYGCRLWFGLIRRTVYAIDKQGRIVFAERGMPDLTKILAVLRGVQPTV